MAYDMTGIGNRMRIARQSKDLKQLAISERLNMSQANYSNIESGNQEIYISQLLEIANVLGVSASWLLGEDSIPDLTDAERLDVQKYIDYLISKHK